MSMRRRHSIMKTWEVVTFRVALAWLCWQYDVHVGSIDGRHTLYLTRGRLNLYLGQHVMIGYARYLWVSASAMLYRCNLFFQCTETSYSIRFKAAQPCHTVAFLVLVFHDHTPRISAQVSANDRTLTALNRTWLPRVVCHLRAKFETSSILQSGGIDLTGERTLVGTYQWHFEGPREYFGHSVWL